MPTSATRYDAVILGAGGAGLMCALQAGRRGKKILILDHAERIGGKILISGGGRCNFTNLNVSAANFVSDEKSFPSSSLSKYQPKDFIAMVQTHQIPYYEKKLGQLFCRSSARDIVKMLVLECEKVGVEIMMETSIQKTERLKSASIQDPRFAVLTSRGEFRANHLVIATGGYSFPKLGATGLGFEIAKDYGHRLVETAPALDGFVFTDPSLKPFSELAGISLDCLMTCGGLSFRENLLFTHVGMSGPAALQASLHWRPGMSVSIDLLPEQKLAELLKSARAKHPQWNLKKFLASLWVERFADLFCENFVPDSDLKVSELRESQIKRLKKLIHEWQIKPSSTVGYHKAEVTRGGVDTTQVSAKTMQSKLVPGLFFVGEVLDVTGWLGGYNFQWAWASGYSAAQAM